MIANQYSITIPQRNNTAPKTVLYNLTKSANMNDISDINYTAGATNNNVLKALSQRFCDNIILYYLVPIDPNNKNKVEYLSKFLAEYTAKIKRLLTEHNINISKRHIKPTYSNKEDHNYKQYIKVASPKILIDDVFASITNFKSY